MGYHIDRHVMPDANNALLFFGGSILGPLDML